MSNVEITKLNTVRAIPKIIVRDNAEYHLVGRIGGGNYGRVYSAVESTKAFKRSRAIKVVSQDEVPPSMIANEAKMHEMCHKHPNVLKLSNVFTVAPYTYFVMPRMQYSLDKRQYMTRDFVRTIFRQMVSAVAHVHGQRVIHHDVKLGNFMITDNDVVFFGDFGLATFMGESPACFLLQGTPNAIAPEMALDIFRTAKYEPLIGHSYAVDVWGLGICLYEMLCGREPFTRSRHERHRNLSDVHRIYYSIIEDTPSFTQFGASDASLLSAMLEKDPAKRITIAGILAHEFLTA